MSNYILNYQQTIANSLLNIPVLIKYNTGNKQNNLLNINLENVFADDSSKDYIVIYHV